VPEYLVIPYARLNELHFLTSDFTFDYGDVTYDTWDEEIKKYETGFFFLFLSTFVDSVTLISLVPSSTGLVFQLHICLRLGIVTI